MERNTQTTVRQLKIGDRFFKASDKKRIPWQMVEADMKKTYFKHYHYWAKLDNCTKPEPLDGATKVVFLRNVNDKL